MKDMQGTPCLLSWVWAIYTRKTPNRRGFDMYTFLNSPLPQNFLDLSFYSEQTTFYDCEFRKIVWHFFWVSAQFFLAKFPDCPWVFRTQVPWLSLTLAINKLQGSIIFRKSESKEFKEILGENLHNFKEILFMMYVYHKAAFSFEVSSSNSTFDAR